MKMIRLMCLALTGGAAVSFCAPARGDHETEFTTIGVEAENINCAARDLDDELRYRFHDSCLFRELLATNSRIRGKASSLRAQARSRSCGRSFERTLRDLDDLICRMDGLISEARVRALRGIEPPLGCTQPAEYLVARMRRSMLIIERQSRGIAASDRIEYGEIAPDAGGRWGYEGWAAPGGGYGVYAVPTRNFGREFSVGRTGLTIQNGRVAIHLGR
jgi:hypothetical protein